MANFTQDAILKTFGDLLEALPFEKITVSTLIRECNISRNTFYYHYPDIYALLDDWISKSLGKYSALEDDGSWQENIKALLYACRDNKKKVYHIFNSLSRDRLERYIFDRTDNLVYNFLLRRTQGKSVGQKRVRDLSDIIRYAIYGYFMRFLWNGMEDDIDAAVDNLGILFEEILDSLLP